MANVIAAGLQQDLILSRVLEAFKQTLLPLALISTAFYDVVLDGTDKALVEYYPLETAASKDFNGAYTFTGGTSVATREVTVNKRKYQDLSYTSAELRRQPRFDPERWAIKKGNKLAEDVLGDVLSVVTAANYGAAIFTGIASTFDVDDTIDMESTLTIAKWPRLGRGMIIDPTYLGELKKDMNANGGVATFARDSNGNSIAFPSLNGFSIADSNVIPTNGENLKGMVIWPSAILAAFSPIEPASEVRANMTAYEKLTDEDTGMTLEYRAWGDPDTDTTKKVIECNYGFGVGQEEALKRIISA